MLSDKSTIEYHVTKCGPDCVSRAWTFVEMVLVLAAMVLFNFFPDRIGFIRSLTDPSSFRPLLAPEFQEHLPWLNVYWGLALTLCAVNLTLGRWTLTTRWAELGLNALAAYILWRMLLGGPLIVYLELTLLVKFGLAIALIVTSIEIVVKLIRLLTHVTTLKQTEQW